MLCFSGDVITATDIADRLGVASVGDPKLTERIPLETANKAYEAMRAMVEDAIGSANSQGFRRVREARRL